MVTPMVIMASKNFCTCKGEKSKKECGPHREPVAGEKRVNVKEKYGRDRKEQKHKVGISGHSSFLILIHLVQTEQDKV